LFKKKKNTKKQYKDIQRYLPVLIKLKDMLHRMLKEISVKLSIK